MTKLKKYNTIEEYNNDKPNRPYPSVSLAGGNVYFAKFPIHKLPIKAVFFDNSTNKFVKLYPSQIIEANPNYTPIGVEVIPAEHDVYGTGQSGVMSLAEMNCNAPDTGSDEYQGIYFSSAYENTQIPKLTLMPTINLSTGESNGSYGYGVFPSDAFSNFKIDDVSGYHSSYTSYRRAPSPYSKNGDRNDVYYSDIYSDYANRNVFSDFNGYENSETFYLGAAAQTNWKTDPTITNSSGNGYFPSLCCCWRFHTSGTNKYQWYLPAMGELGYMMNRVVAINETINKIKSVYSSAIAVEIGIDNAYWSSTQHSANMMRMIRINDGYAAYRNKTKTANVRAFIRI